MHFKVGAETGSVPADCATAPSEDVVTVVDDTCREPLDLLPDDPVRTKRKHILIYVQYKMFGIHSLYILSINDLYCYYITIVIS